VINVLVWKWKSETYRHKYTAEHVNVMFRMFARHYHLPFRFVCVTDDVEAINCETFPLWNDCSKLVNPNGVRFPSCFRRLKMFDSEQLAEMGIKQGEMVLSLDLDMAIVANVTELFRREENFVGWQGVGAYRPRVYNGSIILHRAGTMDYLWKEFDPLKSPAEAKRNRYFGSDQGYISWKLDGKAPGLDRPDILSFHRDIKNRHLPEGARIVSFNGQQKPWEVSTQADAPWLTEHWK
jgi:hypothetical protein